MKTKCKGVKGEEEGALKVVWKWRRSAYLSGENLVEQDLKMKLENVVRKWCSVGVAT